MRLPNGFGGISKLSGNRRKPYIVRVTDGWTDEGKQIKKIIGYFATKKEALETLTLYNKNPNMIETNKITFKEVFDKWFDERKKDKLSKSAENNYIRYFNKCESIHNIPFNQLKTPDLTKIVDTIQGNGSARNVCKSLLSQMYEFAIQNDIVDKNYASFIKIKMGDKLIERTVFTKNEITTLFNNINNYKNIDMILIMIYTGLRPSELLELKTKDIYLKEKYFRCGLKTEAGKNRLVPINDKILPLIKARYNINNEYLILNSNGNKMKYDNFNEEYFKPIMKGLNMSHYPHDCRHTFATLLYEVEADKTSIIKLIGHTNIEMTNKVYTHADIEILRKAIKKLG